MDSVHDTLAGGLPHSDIHGSKPALGSPWLFAECHVLHRLSVPRHPPNALVYLISSRAGVNPRSRRYLRRAGWSRSRTKVQVLVVHPASDQEKPIHNVKERTSQREALFRRRLKEMRRRRGPEIRNQKARSQKVSDARAEVGPTAKTHF
jgi:hypothetical protein